MSTSLLLLCVLGICCVDIIVCDVTAEKIDIAIRRVQEELNLIYNRYEMFKPIGEAFFLMQHNLSPRDMDLLKLQFAMKIISKDSSYTMIFGGSSVTAGHDNAGGQAYPQVIKKKMEPMLNAVGIQLNVYNIAQGANGCLPSNWCYSSMGGDNADVIGWEQTFNCGAAFDIMELMYRTAYWSKSHLQVGSVYLAASGSGYTADCPVTDFGKPYSDEDWTPSDDNLSPWYPNQTTLSDWRSKLDVVLRLNGPTFSEAIIPPYRDLGLAINSFRFSQKYQLWWCRTIFGDNHTKATPNFIFHSASRPDRWTCEPDKIYSKCAIKFLRKESSEYGRKVKKRSHHPPRAHHMMRAEFFVFHYGMAFLEALYAVKEDLGLLNTGSQEVASSVLIEQTLAKYGDALAILAPNLTKPLLPPISVKDPQLHHTSHRPECFTDYRPHYNKEMTLTGQIVGKHQWIVDSELHPPVPDKTFYESRPSVRAVNGSLSRELFLAVKIADMSKHVVLCSYMGAIDEKSLRLSVELHVDQARLTEAYSPMLVPETPPLQRRLHEDADDRQKGDLRHHHQARHKQHRQQFPSMHADYYAYNHTYHADGRVIWSNVTMENSCLVMWDVPSGQHVMGVRTTGGQKPFSLTHMIVVS